MYSVLYTKYSVLLSPLWLKSVPGWPAISVRTSQQSRVGQIVWFGCLSAISQLASRVGEGGGVRHFFLHSVTQPYTTWSRWRERGGGLCSLPLGPMPTPFHYCLPPPLKLRRALHPLQSKTSDSYLYSPAAWHRKN